MNGFTLHLCGATQSEAIPGVASFVGEDASGQFGILPGREPLVTVLASGLVRFRTDAAAWHYVALTSATLRFTGQDLYVATRRYLRGDDYRALSETLARQSADDARHRGRLRDNLRQLEQAMFERLRKLDRT